MSNRTDKIKFELDLHAEKAEQEIHRLNKSIAELRKQNADHRKEITRLAATEGDHSKEVQRLNDAIDKNNSLINQNKRAIEEESKKIDLSRKTSAELKRELKQLQRNLANTSKALNPEKWRETEKEIKRYQDAIKKAEAGTVSFKDRAARVATTVKGFFTGLGMSILNLVTGSLKNAFNIVVDFEKANARLASILGTSTQGIKELEAGARHLGATTSFTAAEVTNLQIELAKLGFDKTQILNMESGVLKFAKAVDTNLAQAAAFAGAALRIFNKDASETDDVLATFAVATTKTALDFSKLEASLSTVGPVANAFGLSLEDTTALLGLLANAGFDASSAATATRNIILKLCDANGSLAQALGGPVKNADDLARGLKKLNDEGVDLATALELTDKRSVAAFASFLNSADQLTTLRDSITDVTGEFNQMSVTMGDTVAGAMAGLQSAAQELVLKISQGTTGPIKDLIKGMTSVVQWIGKVIEWCGRFSTQIKVVVAAILGYKAALAAVTLLQKGYHAALALGKAVMAAYSATTKLLSATFHAMKGNIAAATTSLNGLKAAMATAPWGAILAVISSIVAAFMTLKKSTEEEIETETEWSKALERISKLREEHKESLDKLNDSIATEIRKVQELRAALKSENVSKEEKLKIIERLKKSIPGYTAQLSKEGKLIKENTKAVDDYVKSLEKRMRINYYKDEYQKYINADEAAKRRQREAQAYYDEHAYEVITETDKTTQQAYFLGLIPLPWRTTKTTTRTGMRKDFAYDEVNAKREAADWEAKLAQKALDDLKEGMKAAGISLEDLITETAETAETADITSSSMKSTASATTEVVDEVKKLKSELKSLRKQEAKDDAEYFAIQDRKKAIQDRLNAINGKGNKKKHEAGTYGEDSIDEATAAVDDRHQKNLLDINKMKGEISDAELLIKKNEELLRYNNDLLLALDTLKSKVKNTHQQTFDKIREQQNNIAQSSLAAQMAINKARLQLEKEDHSDRMALLKTAYEEESAELERKVLKEETTREAAEIRLLHKQREYHQSELDELNAYYRKIESADYLGKQEKEDLLESIRANIRGAQSKVLTDTGKFSEKMREMTTNAARPEGLAAAYDLQVLELRSAYDEMIEIVGRHSDEAVRLEEEKQRRIADLNYQYQEQMWQLAEVVGLTWDSEYRRELAKLKNYHRQGLMSEKQFQGKRLQLGMTTTKKYYDYYAGLSSSMFTAIQDAEIAKSDAKYDVLIKQAENNGQDTAALEEEKENKKLEIQKKYADVNFAIKISEIIANTAVSIMKAFSELGPIGGAVAAALLTATGVAQVIAAKAERDKIKNMQPGNASASSTTPSAPKNAQRVLSGYAEGGYTGDGGRYEVAGVVHKGEYVVPKPIMSNPRVVDAVGTIEAIRLNRLTGQTSRPAAYEAEGFAEGGYTSSTVAIDLTEFNDTVAQFKQAVKSIRAYVVLRDIDEARDRLDRAQRPFTKNH